MWASLSEGTARRSAPRRARDPASAASASAPKGPGWAREVGAVSRAAARAADASAPAPCAPARIAGAVCAGSAGCAGPVRSAAGCAAAARLAAGIGGAKASRGRATL